ncbi:MAG: CrcB family protein [Gemmatimonadales bacterium]|nr:MAG: CrcB family protein [Gemmatimonadales bacterium]
MTMLLVAAGGSLGAIARYLVDFWVVSRGISRVPLGTVVVNVSGSFALGLLVGVLGTTGGPDWILTLVGTGFLAAYTTFSTWMFEAARLVQRGAWSAALVHLSATVVLGVAFAGAGLWLGSAIVLQ